MVVNRASVKDLAIAKKYDYMIDTIRKLAKELLTEINDYKADMIVIEKRKIKTLSRAVLKYVKFSKRLKQ